MSLLIIATIALLLLLYGVLFLRVHRKVFNRPYLPENNIHLLEDFTEKTPDDIIWIKTSAGRIWAWLYLPQNSPYKKHPLLIYTHGNGARIEELAPALKEYCKENYAVLIPEYRGYGDMPGHPTRHRINKDLCRFYDTVCAREDIDENFVVLHGRSLGGGVACDLAEKRPIQAMILESTYTRMSRVIHERHNLKLPLFLFWSVNFQTIDTLKSFKKPVLVCHGSKDPVIGIHQAEEMAEAAQNGRLLRFEEADHRSIIELPEFWQKTREFLRKLLANHEKKDTKNPLKNNPSPSAQDSEL